MKTAWLAEQKERAWRQGVRRRCARSTRCSCPRRRELSRGERAAPASRRYLAALLAAFAAASRRPRARVAPRLSRAEGDGARTLRSAVAHARARGHAAPGRAEAAGRRAERGRAERAGAGRLAGRAPRDRRGAEGPRGQAHRVRRARSSPSPTCSCASSCSTAGRGRRIARPSQPWVEIARPRRGVGGAAHVRRARDPAHPVRLRPPALRARR